MTDRPIIFSGAMVLALLAGRKTQTRRLLTDIPAAPKTDSLVHTPKHDLPYFDAYCGGKKTPANPRGMTDHWCWWTRDDRAGHGCKVPFVPGDRLYVREDHYRFGFWEPVPGMRTKAGRLKWRFVGDPEIRFDAPANVRLGRHHKDPGMPAWHKRLGRFMFRRDSRMTLIVEDVRVQRLQDISEADCLAEGPEISHAAGSIGGPLVHTAERHIYATPRAWYRELWNSLHTKPGERWDDSPFVVAVSFRAIAANIDKIGATA